MRRRTVTSTIIGVVVVGSLAGVVAGGWTWNQHRIAAAAAVVDYAPLAHALEQHQVGHLVVPTSQAAKVHQGIPATAVQTLDSCTPPTQGTWQQSSFAYLLETGSQACSLNQVVTLLGKPNTSLVFKGTVEHPEQSLLFYDRGKNDKATTGSPASVVPVALDKLPPSQTGCTSTIMNIVAHQDDDLLFMNPDTLHDIRSGSCVRSVYLTAGDGGNNRYYWLSREQGAEQAYSYMSEQDDGLWVQRIVKLGSSHYITIATPRDNPKLSLIFLRLPDGNLNGTGFPATHHESLAHLRTGSLKVMHSVDGQSAYGSKDLQAALTSLLQYYEPTTVRSLSSQRAATGNPYLEHSDHISSGLYAEDVYKPYSTRYITSLALYHGYLVHGRIANVAGADLSASVKTFLQYASRDKAVCQTYNQCIDSPTYGSYLTRQYKADY